MERLTLTFLCLYYNTNLYNSLKADDSFCIPLRQCFAMKARNLIEGQHIQYSKGLPINS